MSSINAVGVILAGGGSRRMGVSKETLVVGDVSMLDRTAEQLHACVETIVVVRSSDFKKEAGPTSSRWTDLCDDRPFRGPLAGLVTALAFGPPGWRLVAPCDHPGLKSAFLEQLLSFACDPFDAVAVKREGYRYPLPAAYHTRILPIAQDLAQDDRHGLRHLLDAVHTRSVDFQSLAAVDPEGQSLRSIDTPEDFQQFQNHL